MSVTEPEKLLSVVIPVYNRKELVVRSVRSVLSQALPPGWEMELLVVDDGSTDGTGETLDKLRNREQPETFRVIHRARGGTPGGARNHGVASSRGRLIAFLDSDDEWLPEKLLRQMPLHEFPDACDLSHTRERWVRNGREVSQTGRRLTRHKRSGDLLEDSLVKCIIGPSTVMMTRDVWEKTGGFRDDLEVAEDYEYWLRLVTITDVAYLDNPLTVKYAGHGDQLSEKYGHIERFRIEGLRDLVEARWFETHRDGAAQGLAERELGRKAAIYARGAARRGRTEEARRFETLARGMGFFDIS